MKINDIVNEDNVVKGDFSSRGGPKQQTQNATQVELRHAFGSNAYNVLHDVGIKFIEKPSYWEDIIKQPIGEVMLRKAAKSLANAGIDLPELDAWEVYSVDPNGGVVRGPMADVIELPEEKVFVIRNLPYAIDGKRQIGDFLVSTDGARSYIRMWRKI